MNTTTPNFIESIVTEMTDCVRCAREHGYKGTAYDYNLTDDDQRSIIAALGRTPTQDEWIRAIFRFMTRNSVEKNA